MIDLILFRPARNSTIYLMDSFTGIIYGSCRRKSNQFLLLNLGRKMDEDGDLRPMKETKKLREVRVHYNRTFGA